MIVLNLLFIICGAVLLVNSLVMAFSASINAGTFLTFLASVLFILFGVFLRNLPKWIKITFPICVLAVFVFTSFLFIYGQSDNADCKEDALIVLGAGLKGDKPSKSLIIRLDAAIEYHKKNPSAYIVVSGGMGHGESITEALAMEKYLIQNGVDPSVIIKEERSTSTKENFIFSKQLLDEKFDHEYSVCFVSNDFHIYRSIRYAEIAGFKSITHISGKTPISSAIPSGLRECLCVIKLWIID